MTQQQQRDVFPDYEQKCTVAQSEFEKFDFGDGVSVHDHDLWEVRLENDYTKITYLEYPQDMPDAPLHRVTFHVRFDPDGKRAAAYAIEYVTGRLIGVRVGDEIDVNALEASAESLMAAETALRQFAFLVLISNTIDHKETLPSGEQAVADVGGDRRRGLLVWVHRVIEWNDLNADATLTKLIPIARDAVAIASRKAPGSPNSESGSDELEMALALGFDSVAAMRSHQDWLAKHGTPEYHRWLATLQQQADGLLLPESERPGAVPAERGGRLVVIIENGAVQEVLASGSQVLCLVLDRDDPCGAANFDTAKGIATLDAMALGLPKVAEGEVDLVFESVAKCLSDPSFQGNELAERILSSIRKSPPPQASMSSEADLVECLRHAVARVRIANEEGDLILSAWLPGAERLLREATANYQVPSLGL